jgi:hypothetical protein
VIDDVPYEFSQVKTQDSIQTISKKNGIWMVFACFTMKKTHGELFPRRISESKNSDPKVEQILLEVEARNGVTFNNAVRIKLWKAGCSEMAMAISCNWLFLWDYKFYKWG